MLLGISDEGGNLGMTDRVTGGENLSQEKDKTERKFPSLIRRRIDN